MESPQDNDICLRISQVRLELSGPRGKARFAKQLGISASTYDYYESSRVPPAGVLIRISEVAGVDLHWLLTGQAGGISANHPAIQRAAALLADQPDAAGPLAAFVELLSEMHQVFPAEQGDASPPAIAPPLEMPVEPEAENLPLGSAALIPILGRSAAGVPQYWSKDQGAGVTELAELIDRYARREVQSVQPAEVSDGGQETIAQIVTVQADPTAGPVQFVRADQIKGRYPDAFALQIDGNSMSPEIRHGDLVVLSPSAPAADGRAAVVQLAGQIGVTCKLYRRSGDDVHLVPISEDLGPVTVGAAEVVWSLRVLARVRPGVSGAQRA